MQPRLLKIIFKINRRRLDEVCTRFPGDKGRLDRVSLIEEGSIRHVRMANLAIVGSHSTNGVAEINSQLLRTVTVKDLEALYPERFNNNTYGVTPRRSLIMGNPAFSYGTATLSAMRARPTSAGEATYSSWPTTKDCRMPFTAPNARPNYANYGLPIGSRRYPARPG